MEINTYTISTPGGRNFTLSTHEDDQSVQPSIAEGHYEMHVQVLIEEFCKNKTAILDIGANYGQHTLLMAALNPAATVTAIEAAPENIEVLNHNIAANNISNITVIQAFLGAKKGEEIDYFYETANAGCAFGCETEYGDAHHPNLKRRVTTTTVDDLIDGPIDFIKMDIEGAELEAIAGGAQVFGECEHLLVELNKFTMEKFRGQSIDQLIDKIESLGFKGGLIFGSNQFHQLTIQEIRDVMAQNVMCEVMFTK